MKKLLIILVLLALVAPVRAQSIMVRNGPWSAAVALATGDATKTLKAAPGAGRILYVTYLYCTIVTSAAQTSYVGDSSATIKVLSLAASPTANTAYFIGPMQFGVPLTVNEALIIKPAAAGPAMNCVAEGYVRG